MNEPMRLLYTHTLNTGFAIHLRTQEYQAAQLFADQLLRKLDQTLAGDQLTLFEQYVEAIQSQQLLELEAMFQAAFALPNELG